MHPQRLEVVGSERRHRLLGDQLSGAHLGVDVDLGGGSEPEVLACGAVGHDDRVEEVGLARDIVDELWTQMTHDEATGRLTQMTVHQVSGGGSLDGAHKLDTHYVYNSDPKLADELSAITHPDGVEETFDRDENGRLRTWTKGGLSHDYTFTGTLGQGGASCVDTDGDACDVQLVERRSPTPGMGLPLLVGVNRRGDEGPLHDQHGGPRPQTLAVASRQHLSQKTICGD